MRFCQHRHEAGEVGLWWHTVLKGREAMLMAQLAHAQLRAHREGAGSGTRDLQCEAIT